LFTIHSWLGLFLGIIYLIISVSGAGIVFMREINQFLYGDKIKAGQQHGKKISYDELLAMAQKEYPNSMFLWTGYDPEHPENCPAIFGNDNLPSGLFVNRGWHNDYVDPDTGKIVFRTSSSGTGNIMGWLDSLHASLRLGVGGSFIVTIISLAVMLSLLTGLIFYRKHIVDVLLFRIKIKFKNWRTASSDLHRVIGTWALLFNVLIFFSGFYMYYMLLTPSWWKENWPPRPEVIVSTKRVSSDSLVLAAKQMIPDMQVNFVSVTRDTSQLITIGGTTKEKLFLDADNYASVVFKTDGTFQEKTAVKWEDMTGWEKYDNLNWFVFHTGWAFGYIGKVLWTVFGFAPAILSISGFVLWWRKKKFFPEKRRTEKRLYSSVLKSNPNSQVQLRN